MYHVTSCAIKLEIMYNHPHYRFIIKNYERVLENNLKVKIKRHSQTIA
jgi:hypothetical protein